MSEINLRDINIEAGIITVMGKGAKERTVPFSKQTKKAIYKYLLMRKDDMECLWVTDEGTPMARHSIYTMIKRRAKDAGVTDISIYPHKFRHTFATDSLLNDAKDWEVQAILGHSRPDMTQRYRATLNSQQALEGHKGNTRRKGFSPVENGL